jgi:hypothetical protein
LCCSFFTLPISNSIKQANVANAFGDAFFTVDVFRKFFFSLQNMEWLLLLYEPHIRFTVKDRIKRMIYVTHGTWPMLRVSASADYDMKIVSNKWHIMFLASPWPRKSTNHYQQYWRDPNLNWDRIAPVGALDQNLLGATHQSNTIECCSAQEPCHPGSGHVMLGHHRRIKMVQMWFIVPLIFQIGQKYMWYFFYVTQSISSRRSIFNENYSIVNPIIAILVLFVTISQIMRFYIVVDPHIKIF